MRRWLVPPLFLLAGMLWALVPAHARGIPPRPASIPANYKGVTTTCAYTPLPTVRLAASAPGAPAATQVTTTYPAEKVEPITDEIRRNLRLNAFYTKILFHRGFPIIGSDKVSDYAFLECACTIDHMLHDSPPAVFDALLKNRVQVGILSVVEFTMDLPNSNNAGRNPSIGDLAFQDRRSRGLGGARLATCAEENLLNLRGDPYTSENITLHEFSHTIASNMNTATPGWYARLQSAFRQATAAGLFANTYAGSNEQEYWAEGAQSWFDCARQRDPSVHSGIWTRDQMKQYDPALAALLKEVYGDGDWRYVKTPANTRLQADGKTYVRTPQELEHLIGLDLLRPQYPLFSFNNSPRVQAANATEAATRGGAAYPDTRPAP